MRCRGSPSSWKLFLLLHASNQFKRLNTLETISEDQNEVMSTGAESESEHNCRSSKTCELIRKQTKDEEKTVLDRDNEENISSEQKERTRKQWETSPDQMKEISRSLSQINASNLDKRHKDLTQSKRSTNEKLSEIQTNRSTLPPINTYSDSDSGKEDINSCICEAMHKSNCDSRHESNQWVVSRPIKNRPKDNLRMEGPMEMQTTFKTTYDSTAKQINDSLSKGVAVVMPSPTVSPEESHFEKLSQTTTAMNAIKSSKKKVKHRPSTSLKAGGNGYFNTINQESYKNFIIIDENLKSDKAKSGSNRKTSGICCAAVDGLRLPKVDINYREDKHCSQAKGREEKSTQMEVMNRSMQRLTTEDTIQSTDDHKYVETSVQTNNNFNQNESKSEKSSKKGVEKRSTGVQHRSEEPEIRRSNDSKDMYNSWTVESLQEHKRIYTRDVDNIKELGILDKLNGQTVCDSYKRETKERQMRGTKESELNSKANDSRVRNESKHYVQSQKRTVKHKNDCSVALFSGQMDFTTTTNTSFADKSPNRAGAQKQERERTAGKRSRKSGRKRNLFRTSTEAEFSEPYGENTSETTYQNQFGDRLYCPAIDLGSKRSDFKYSGETSGHKFFLPEVKH